MKYLSSLLLLCLISASSFAQLTFHDYEAVNFNGDTVSLSQYAGKKVMVVNVASFCAFTPQYEDLQELYDTYSSQYDFEIVGFPSDDFNNQGGTHGQIDSTCQSYNVTFPLMEKIHCVTGDTAPVYKWLQREDLNGVQSAHVAWNFNKFLIDEAGGWVAHYGSNVDPQDQDIIDWITSASVIDTTDSTTSVVTVDATDMVQLRSANPVCNSIHLQLNLTGQQQVTVGLYALDGKLVADMYNGLTATAPLAYPVSTLPNGIYFLKLQTATAQQVCRVVVQH